MDAAYELDEPVPGVRVLSTNLDSRFLVSTAFAADMRRRGWGRIVNMSSSAIYTTTTAFVILESIRLDLGYGSQIHP